MAEGASGVARILATRGTQVVTHWREIVDEAERLLADPSFDPTAEDRAIADRLSPAWLPEETTAPGAKQRLFTAGADFTATGEGMTLKFCAGYAPSQEAFRRTVWRQMGSYHAPAAIIVAGVDRTIPGYEFLVSAAVERMMHEIASGSDERPGAFSVYLEVHFNYS